MYHLRAADFIGVKIMKIYKLQPPGGTISADSIDCSYDYFEGTGQIDGIENLSTEEKAEELEKAGLIKFYRNRFTRFVIIKGE
jgi:hypothetical protein|tara:strand:- start:192 stop:440 length:249 start_codon:yes stop_codon:yes gene_type:complete